MASAGLGGRLGRIARGFCRLVQADVVVGRAVAALAVDVIFRLADLAVLLD